MNAPCYNCKEREVGCHSFCEKYIKYDNENKKRIEENHNRIRSDPDYMPNNYQKRGVERIIDSQKRGRKLWK